MTIQQDGLVIKFTLLCVMLSGLLSCTAIQIPTLPQDAPLQWNNQHPYDTNALAPDLHSWWTFFNDKQLDELVDKAIDENLTLAQAKSKMRRVRFLLGHAGDQFLPQLEFSAHSVDSVDTLDSYFQYGLDASWELGLFGRKNSKARIAKAKMESTIAEAQALQVSVIAEVVRTYIELRTGQQHIKLLEQQLDIVKSQVKLTELQIKLGLSSNNELVDVNEKQREIQRQLLIKQQFSSSAVDRLALLLGQKQANKKWLDFSAMPSASNAIFKILPAEMLRTRPEIKLAEAEVLQAAGELGIAKSDIYPHISLGATFLYSINISRNQNLLNASSSAGIGPVIDIPLFDWGYRQAMVNAKNSALNESLLGYKEAVLEAVYESEQAMSALNLRQTLLKNAQVDEALKAQTLERERQRVTLGLSSHQKVNEQRMALIQSQLNLADEQASQNLAFIALYKAFGGAPIISIENTTNLLQNAKGFEDSHHPENEIQGDHKITLADPQPINSPIKAGTP